jgi:hypothetical protein
MAYKQNKTRRDKTTMNKKLLFGLVLGFMFLFSVSYARAEITTHNVTAFQDDVTPVSYKIGALFTPKYSMTLNNVTYAGASGGSYEDSRWYIYDSTCTTNLKNGTISNQIATVEYNLTAFTTYCLVSDKAGSNRDFGKYPSGAAPTYPIQRTVMNFTARRFGTTSDTAGSIPKIYQIFTTNFTSSVNFTVSAFDNFDSSAIDNFSVEIGETNYTTTNGSVTTGLLVNATRLYNFTVFNAINNAGAYFNRTFYNQNISTHKTATMSQTEIIVNATTKITSTSISGTIYNVSQTLANTGSHYGFKAGSYNLTFYNASWFNKTQEFTFTALQNTTVNLTGVYDQILNFTARQLINNTATNNFNITMTTSTGYTETITTNNGTMFFNVIKNLNITAHIIAPNHADQTDTNYDYINSSTRQYNKTFSLLPDKSFQIFVRDLLNNALLNDITMYMYGATTETAMFNQSIYRINLTSGTYNFIFNKTGYAELTDTMTIANYEFINRTEYLTANPTNIVVYVKNNYDQYLSNVLVTIKRQYDNTTVDTETTDFTGAVSFNLNPSLTYYIQVEAEGYPVFFETLNIITSPVIVVLTTSGTTINSYYSGINYNITPNNVEPLINNTDYTFTFTYASGFWNVTNCYITIANLDNYTTTILNTNSTTCTNTGSITTAINTGQNITLSLYTTLEIQGTTNITYQTTYTTGYFYEGEISLVHAIKSLFSFNKAGFTNKFGQLFLFFILMIVILEGLMFKDQEQITPYLSEQQSALISVVVFLITLGGAELGLINLGLTGVTGEIVRWGIPLLLAIPMVLLLLKAYGEQ